MDTLASERRVRTFNIVDEVTRECVAVDVTRGALPVAAHLASGCVVFRGRSCGINAGGKRANTMAGTGSKPSGTCGESVNGRALEIIGQLAGERNLSGREYEVLAATVRGESTKQIGYALMISANTVAYYWAQIFRKLGCRSQIEVMSLLFRRATAATTARPVLTNSPTTLESKVCNETR